MLATEKLPSYADVWPHFKMAAVAAACYIVWEKPLDMMTVSALHMSKWQASLPVFSPQHNSPRARTRQGHRVSFEMEWGCFFFPCKNELIISFAFNLFICSLKDGREAHCASGAWHDVSYLVEEHPGCSTCHRRRELCFYLTSRRSSSRPGTQKTNRHSC